MTDLTFITSNEEKIRYVKKWFDRPFSVSDIDLPEIQSLNLHEVTADKLLRAYELLRVPVFVEDVSLTLNALGQLPGPLVKWFLKDLKIDGIVKLVDNYEDRTAVASIEYGLHDGKKCHYFTGSVKGTIAKASMGNTHFGWNSIFIPDGQKLTYAQMDDAVLKKYSHRAKAIEKMQAYLSDATNHTESG